ncbi:MAG TPA: hypothetical protein PKG77_07025 [Phycisphaerae bacterium]|nr:hypothetical protein [Phycisphaerae bacterium]HQL72421.1 hypothetical protein [Phycisphaerae bacterium]
MPADQAGKTTRCPRCKQGVVVPPRSALTPPRPLVAKPVEEDSGAPDAQDTAPPLSVQAPPEPPAASGGPATARPAEAPAPLVPPPAPEEPIEAYPVSAPAPPKPQPPARTAASSALESLAAAAAPHKAAEEPKPAPPLAPRHPAKARHAPTPHPPARPVLHPPKAGGPDVRQVIMGAAVLATIVAPWFILAMPGPLRGLIRSTAPRLVMSWDILSDAPAGIGAFLVAAWIVALAAVVVGLTVRGLPRAAASAGLGLLGLIFFLTAGIDALAPVRWAGHAPSVLVTLVLVFLPWLLAAGHCRLRLGQSLPARVSLCGLGGVVAILTVILLVFLLMHFFDLPSESRRAFIIDLAVLAVALMVVTGGSVVLAVDGGSPRAAPQRCSGGLGILYTGLAAIALYLVVRPNLTALTDGPRNYALLPTFLLLMLALFGMLLCGGVVRAVCRGGELYRTRSRRPASSGEASSPGAAKG